MAQERVAKSCFIKGIACSIFVSNSQNQKIRDGNLCFFIIGCYCRTSILIIDILVLCWFIALEHTLIFKPLNGFFQTSLYLVSCRKI